MLSRVDGVILLISYILYASFVLRRAQGIEKLMDTFERPKLSRTLVEFVASLVLLLGSSQLIVKSAIDLSGKLGMELGLIGLSLTAIGTSLPEIAFSFAAIKKHAKEEILGDIIGSVVANSTFVLGIAAIIYPIDVASSHIGFPTLFLMVLTLLFFLKFARSKERLDTLEGFFLVVVYVLFLISEFWISKHF